MSTKMEREKFETWLIQHQRALGYGECLSDQELVKREENGEYTACTFEKAWEAWQAAAPGEFERGWLQGREQEKALWELTAAGQAIENLEDAQNYRWLRDRAINHEAFGEHLAWCVIGTSANDCRPCQGAELDAVIALARAADAAIR